MTGMMGSDSERTKPGEGILGMQGYRWQAGRREDEADEVC